MKIDVAGHGAAVLDRTREFGKWVNIKQPAQE